jgi:hypothetical protein
MSAVGSGLGIVVPRSLNHQGEEWAAVEIPVRQCAVSRRVRLSRGRWGGFDDSARSAGPTQITRQFGMCRPFGPQRIIASPTPGPDGRGCHLPPLRLFQPTEKVTTS